MRSEAKRQTVEPPPPPMATSQTPSQVSLEARAPEEPVAQAVVASSATEENEDVQDLEDDIDPDIRREIDEALAMIRAYNNPHRAAVAREMAEVPLEKKISLHQRQLKRVEKFYTGESLSYRDFEFVFVNILGGEMKRVESVIRKFKFLNCPLKYTAYGSPRIGRHQLTLAQSFLRDHLGLSLHSFESKK